MRISVIIPALDEEAHIGGAIESAFLGGADEVVVADGFSRDKTAAIAKALGAKVVTAPRSRGAQMDAAADKASGDVFVFLHADARLPVSWRGAVEKCLEDKLNIGGAFTLAIDSPRSLLKLIEKAACLRARVFGLIYGDQALFSRREAFFASGGFMSMPLMEDVDYVKRLRMLGRVALLPQKVSVSPRRWERRGAAGVTARNAYTLFMYLAGASPDALYRGYYKGSEGRTL